MIKFIELYEYKSGNKFYDKFIKQYKLMQHGVWGIFITDDDISPRGCVGIVGGYNSPYYDYYHLPEHECCWELNIQIKVWNQYNRDQKINEILNG